MVSCRALLNSYTLHAALGVALLLSASCNCPPYCPPPGGGGAACPTSFIQPSTLAPAPPAQKTSVDLSLSGFYLQQRIKQMLDVPDRDASGNLTQSGVNVGRIQLKQTAIPGGTASLLTVELEPWLRGQSGNRVSLNNHYVLQLRLKPYVVNPTTVSDPAQRARLLCGRDETCTANAKKLVCEQQPQALAQCPAAPGCTANEGMLLGFELYELDNISQGTVVSNGAGACGSQHNIIDDQVLTGLWGCSGALTSMLPFALPTGDIASMVASFTGQTVSATGVALATDGDLKLGLAFGSSAHDFTTDGDFSNTGTDWGIFVDPGLIMPQMKSAIGQAMRSVNSHEPVDILAQSINMKFCTGPQPLMPITSIDILTDGLIQQCGDPHLGICAHTELAVCRQSGANNVPGKAVLMSCQADSDTHFSGTWVQQACIGLVDYVWPVLQFWTGGSATATIGGPCTVMTELEFPVDKKTGDTFYATDLYTSPQGGFIINGHSTMLDGVRTSAGAQGTPVPPACSWPYLGNVKNAYGDCGWDYLNRMQCR